MTYAHMEHDDMMDINVHELTCECSALLLANAFTQIGWGDFGRHEVGEPYSDLGRVILLVGGPEQDDFCLLSFHHQTRGLAHACDGPSELRPLRTLAS